MEGSADDKSDRTLAEVSWIAMSKDGAPTVRTSHSFTSINLSLIRTM